MTRSDPDRETGDDRLDARALRRAFGAFMTGVTVVATKDADGAPRGFTANSFTSVSLAPPLLLFCLGRQSSTAPVFAAAEGFAVSVLAEDQRGVATAFASRGADRFASCAWRDSAAGWPVIDGAAAWFDCAVETRTPAGDHDVIIGRVLDFGVSDANGLGYARGGFFTLGLSQAALAAAAGDAGTRFGAIVEREGPGGSAEILLAPTAQGGWAPPIAEPGPGAAADLGAMLEALGAPATVGALYAVFESARTGAHYVFHRAAAARDATPETARFFELEALPWDAIEGDALRAMLKAYVEEHRARRFKLLFGADASAAAERLVGG